MIEKRHWVDRYLAELEIARTALNDLANRRGASEKQRRDAAIHAKRVEVKVAGARLAQTEYYLHSLRARLDFLQARSAQDMATKREEDELVWARAAVPVNAAAVTDLARELESRKRELDELMSGVRRAS